VSANYKIIDFELVNTTSRLSFSSKMSVFVKKNFTNIDFANTPKFKTKAILRKVSKQFSKKKIATCLTNF